ncbi:MAG: PotD/PotF family extracellular solute-binding protein [Gammaproteobacteria bacterium]
MKMIATFIFLINILFFQSAFTTEKVLNLYVWYNEIPSNVIKQFKKETGIRINISTFDDNETLYAKLKAAPQSGYDIIEPSGYYTERMQKEGMLLSIDHSKLKNLDAIYSKLRHPAYDPKGLYSIPYIWGVTGIFVNKNYFDPKSVEKWSDLWQKRFYNKISLLNDPREVFSMSLLSLGFSANDENPEHIKVAYNHLKKLLPNIKLFNSDAIPSLFIDEDATVGMAWNGDIFRATKENPNLVFIYPKDGFIIWVDTFAIPKYAPHVDYAYQFLNFMLRPEIAKQVTLKFGYPTANKVAHDLLPDAIRNNQIIFPLEKTLDTGEFQIDISDKALALYAHYWEQLKITA